MNNPIHRPKSAANYLGIGLSTYWAKLSPSNPRYDPTFPRPFKINGENGRAVGVRQSELDNWLEQQQAKGV